MSYEESYAKAFPFDKMVDGMLNFQMIEDMVQLISQALKMERKVAIIINNRVGGKGPLIAQAIATRVLAH